MFQRTVRPQQPKALALLNAQGQVADRGLGRAAVNARVSLLQALDLQTRGR